MYSPERVQAAVSRPAYFELDRSTWDERVARAVNALADCRACPRDCGVNRLKPPQPNANWFQLANVWLASLINTAPLGFTLWEPFLCATSADGRGTLCRDD
jgi:hypothetical protein